MGDSVGCFVGEFVGADVGDSEGCFVGELVGADVGDSVGCFVGDCVGADVGDSVGAGAVPPTVTTTKSSMAKLRVAELSISA